MTRDRRWASLLAGAWPEPGWRQHVGVAVVLIGFLFGLFVGSFLNVVVWRLPRNQSIVQPPSACGSCGTQLAWHDNLPLWGWLRRWGHCRFCGSAFSPRYLFAELAIAGVTALVCWYAWYGLPMHLPSPEAIAWHARQGLPPPEPTLQHWAVALGWSETLIRALVAAVLLVVAWWLVVASVIDCEHQIIPDELVKPFQVATPVVAVLLPLGLGGTWLPNAWYVSEAVGGLRWQPWAGVGTTLLVAVIGVGLLWATLPLARYIYDKRCPPAQRWSLAEHRAFRWGAWWFSLALVPVVGVVIAAGWWASTLPATSPAGSAALVIAMLASRAICGALVGWWSLYLIGLLGTIGFKRNAMGFGDVKWLAALGALVGPDGVLVTVLVAVLVATAVGVPQRLLGGQRELPFGPYLALGTVVALVFGSQAMGLVLPG